MGLDPANFARDLIAREGGIDYCVTPFHPARDVQGPYDGSGNDHPLGARLVDLVTRIMAAEMSVIDKDWDRARVLEYPGGVSAHGRGAADRFWMGLRAAFPSAVFQVHNTIGCSGGDIAPRAALRWSSTGCHDGWGTYGCPTGTPVRVMGMTHAEFGPWGVHREPTLFDEAVNLWRFLLAAGAI